MYNLNDNVNDSFEFQLAGHTYKMRYPTLPEIEKFDKANTDDDATLTSVLESLYDFVEPVGNAPMIQDSMKSQNIKVYRNFNRMVRTEFGLDEA